MWRKPQAIMWERNGDELLVARYLVLRNLVQQPNDLGELNAAAWGELRQLEDRLGLSPMALKRLQWEISENPVTKQAGGESAGQVIQINDRFASL